MPVRTTVHLKGGDTSLLNSDELMIGREKIKDV
jgi:hypothetical protein